MPVSACFHTYELSIQKYTCVHGLCLIGYDVGEGEVVEKAKPLIERILGRRRVTDGDRDTVALDTADAVDTSDMEMPSDAERDGRF
jgi:hypothetical protein